MNIYLAGIIGGLVGGVMFGMMMMKMNMLLDITKLARSNSTMIGFLLHMANSIAIGILYVFGLSILGISGFEQIGQGLIYGLAYGFIWWILGPLILMPLFLKMPVRILSLEKIKETLPASLMGHFVYGALLGLCVAFLV